MLIISFNENKFKIFTSRENIPLEGIRSSCPWYYREEDLEKIEKGEFGDYLYNIGRNCKKGDEGCIPATVYIEIVDDKERKIGEWLFCHLIHDLWEKRVLLNVV